MIQIYKYIYSFQIKDDFRFMRPMLEHRRPWSHTFQQFLKIYQNVYKKYYDLQIHFLT